MKDKVKTNASEKGLESEIQGTRKDQKEVSHDRAVSKMKRVSVVTEGERGRKKRQWKQKYKREKEKNQ